jgi:hypothetical protein
VFGIGAAGRFAASLEDIREYLESVDHKPKDTFVTLDRGAIRVAGEELSVWLSDNYAEDWYRDALAQARFGSGHDARRREIIFASCFAESFIFEWARDKLQIHEIECYFPTKRLLSNGNKHPRYRRELDRKWEEVPRKLHQAGKIGVDPDLDLSRLRDLLKYRHGLIHASASRPATDRQRRKKKPFPTKRDLQVLGAGWAVRIIHDLVSDLCNQLAEPKPTYLEAP